MQNGIKFIKMQDNCSNCGRVQTAKTSNWWWQRNAFVCLECNILYTADEQLNMIRTNACEIGRRRPGRAASVCMRLLRSRLERRRQITHHVFALLQLSCRYRRPQTIHDVLGLAEVDIIQSVADFVLHLLIFTCTSLLQVNTGTVTDNLASKSPHPRWILSHMAQRPKFTIHLPKVLSPDQ